MSITIPKAYLPMLIACILFFIILSRMQPLPYIELMQLSAECRKQINAIYAHHADNIYKTVGFLLIFIGWLMTSKEARSFIKAQKTTGYVLMCVIALLCVFHAFITLNTAQQLCDVLKYSTVPSPTYSFPLHLLGDAAFQLPIFIAAYVILEQAISYVEPPKESESA
ncbi:MAG: hypothetical protein HRT35_14625 [Algicola sp.]|nr:hypothetical protein [Algicola sp.]